MILGRLNHIGVATPSIRDSIAFHRDVMGATAIGEPFDLPAQGVRVCFVDTPNTQIELIEPLGAESPIHGFLAKNPAGGQHHLCYEVPDIEAALAWFEGKGARVLGKPRIGAHGTPIFFVHPRDMGGVLTEIMEAPDTSLSHREREGAPQARKGEGDTALVTGHPHPPTGFAGGPLPLPKGEGF